MISIQCVSVERDGCGQEYTSVWVDSIIEDPIEMMEVGQDRREWSKCKTAGTGMGQFLRE
jgi:hypothetical protein